MNRTIVILGGIAVGFLALIIVVLNARDNGRPDRATPKDDPPVTKDEDVSRAEPDLSKPLPEGVNPRLLKRIEEMEKRLADLETRRDELLAENEELKAKAGKKEKEGAAAAKSEWRLESWEKELGLTAAQKTSLEGLMKGWQQEDSANKPDQQTWLTREAQLRAMLSDEQAAKLHEQVAAEAQNQWRWIPDKIGGIAQVEEGQVDQIRRTIGTLTVPREALIAQAHGLTWPTLYGDALGMLDGILTSDQQNRVTEVLQKYGD